METDKEVLVELGVSEEQAKELYNFVYAHYKLSFLKALQGINNVKSGNDRAVCFYILGWLKSRADDLG